MGISSFLQWLLTTSFAGCILTLVVLMVKFIFGRRMSAGWHYSIWFLLIIKLTVPFAPASSFSIFTALNYLSEQITAGSFPQAGSVEKAHHYLSSHRYNWSGPAGDYSISVSKNNHFTLLFVIWLTGVVFLTLYLILQNRKTVKLLKDRLPINDELVLDRFESCKRTMGIRAHISLLATDRIQIPGLYGMFRPSLLLPGDISKWLSSEQLKYIFLHELAHYKRKDVLINFAICVLQIIHWFNPVIAFAFYQMRQEREAATDSLALSYLDPKDYRSFGNTIIQFLCNISFPKTTVALTLLKDKTSIKRRIANIASYRRRRNYQRLWGSALLLLIGCFGLTNASALPQTDYYSPKVSNVVREDLTGYFNDMEGSFVLFDQSQNKFTIYNEKKSRERVSPDSTFKIYAALIGLENGVLQNANTQIKWDQTVYPFAVWNRDHNLGSAMTYSVNWYFEQVNQQVGEAKMRLSLKRMSYGNGDLSGGLKNFWVESSLKISPIEQVIELKKLDTYKLPFSPQNINTVKNIIKISQYHDAILSGKTGTGAVNRHNIRGWFVGYVVKKERRYYFATYIQDSHHADGRRAKEITLKILKSKNLIGRKSQLKL
jgi:bla regulator protein BlaR1